MADSYKVFDKSPIVDDTASVSINGHSFRKREIALGAVALLALIVCVILAAVLASVKSGGNGGRSVQCPVDKSKDMCFTPTCMKSAANAMTSMNGSVDPCENFYQYACGTWALQNPLKPDVSQLTPAWSIYYQNQIKLRRIMETPVSSSSRWETEKKLKNYFSSCTDHYSGMKLQGTPFLDKVVNKTGGWYVLGTLNPSAYDFQAVLKKTHVDFWTNAFFTFTIRTDWKDWRKVAIQEFMNARGDVQVTTSK